MQLTNACYSMILFAFVVQHRNAIANQIKLIKLFVAFQVCLFYACKMEAFVSGIYTFQSKHGVDYCCHHPKCCWAI